MFLAHLRNTLGDMEEEMEYYGSLFDGLRKIVEEPSLMHELPLQGLTRRNVFGRLALFSTAAPSPSVKTEDMTTLGPQALTAVVHTSVLKALDLG